MCFQQLHVLQIKSALRMRHDWWRLSLQGRYHHVAYNTSIPLALAGQPASTTENTRHARQQGHALHPKDGANLCTMTCCSPGKKAEAGRYPMMSPLVTSGISNFRLCLWVSSLSSALMDCSIRIATFQTTGCTVHNMPTACCISLLRYLDAEDDASITAAYTTPPASCNSHCFSLTHAGDHSMLENHNSLTSGMCFLHMQMLCLPQTT